MNGKRRLHGTTLFLDTTTLGPYQDQWAYLSSLDRLSLRSVVRLVKELGDMRLGHNVRQLELPRSSRSSRVPPWSCGRSSTPGSP